MPTTEFTARNLGIRNEPHPTRDASERERAHRLRLERDAELTALNRRDAARLGLAVVETDGSMSLDETEQVLAAYFGPVIERGPRMRDGAQRAAIRREENAVVNRQLAAFLAYLGDTAPAERPAFPYACECSTLGCAVEVPLKPAAYQAAGQALGHS